MRSANPSDAAGHHEWFSPSYVDGWIKSDGNEASRRRLLAEVVARLDLPVDAPCRVLDIGAGWGPLTRCVLDRYPNATVVAQDFSEPMLNRAVLHLGGHPGQVLFVRADLRDPSWWEVLGSSFDAVVSSLAIHNVRDPDVVARVYADVHGIMRPGGVLADFDVLDGHDAGERQCWLGKAGFADVWVDTAVGGPGTALFTARRSEDTESKSRTDNRF